MSKRNVDYVCSVLITTLIVKLLVTTLFLFLICVLHFEGFFLRKFCVNDKCQSNSILGLVQSNIFPQPKSIH